MTPLSSALRRLGQWPAGHPVVAFFILAVVGVLGAVRAVRIPLDRLALPAVAALRVHAELPGLDPATVQAKVAEPLEQALRGLAGLRGMESHSGDGSADIFLRFASREDRDSSVARVRALVAQSESTLPRGVKPPTVAIDSAEIAPSAIYLVTARALSADLERWARNVLVDPLREVPQIASVTLAGTDRREVLIQPEPRRMTALGLSFDDLIDAVRRSDVVRSHKAAHRQVVSPGSAESVAARAVRLPSGEPIALSEVAKVSLVEAAASGRLRYHGTPALRLEVYPRAAADAVAVARRVHAHVAWLRANDLVPSGAAIHPDYNAAHAVSTWLARVLRRAGICLAIILVVLGALFGRRVLANAAAAFAVWLPVSVAALASHGYALNAGTTTGLTLAAVPFATALVSGTTARALRRIAMVGIIAWVIGLIVAVTAQMSVAFLVALAVAACVRWLMTPWRRGPDGADTYADATPIRWHRMRSSMAATVAAAVVLAGLAASVYLLPSVDPGEIHGTFTFRLRGDDPQRLAAIVDPLVVSLHVIPRVHDIVSSAETRPTWRLHLDPQHMEALGVGLAEIGRAFAIARDGLVVGEIRNPDKELGLRMRLAPGAAGESFERLPLRGETPRQPAIYLRDVGTAEKVSQPRERVRIDGEPAVEVTARWRSTDAHDELRDFCDRVDVPKHYRLDCAIRDSPT